LYASVTDPDGRPLRNLTAQDFVVQEDGTPQEIATFAAGEFPAAVALALDRSVSMKGRPLELARAAARVFVDALRPEDRAMLIGIGGEVQVLAPLSTDRAPLHAALDAVDAWSVTTLYDAVIASLDLLDAEPGRRAIVVLSDGLDSFSRADEAAVLARARRSNVLVYGIAVARKRSTLFAELAAISGGRSFHLRNPKELATTLREIADDLRWQYLLGYQPAMPWGTTAEWRSIGVTVSQRGARVRARSGYMTR
jgi:Ca-activated chloride channel homolog